MCGEEIYVAETDAERVTQILQEMGLE